MPESAPLMPDNLRTTAGQLPTAPVAPRRPYVLAHHGDERIDDWYWLRERDDPDVREYLEAENSFTEAALAHLAPLRDQIFEEIRGRVRESDAAAPVRHGPHEYFRRTQEGLQYPVHCRRPAGTPGLPDPDAAPPSAAADGPPSQNSRSSRSSRPPASGTTSRSAISAR